MITADKMPADIHSCSLYCDRPACIKHQRDEMREKIQSGYRQRLALENVRLLAARHCDEEWAKHMLRFCDDAGITANSLRSMSAENV
jgi:hypothetical protein